MWAIHAFVLGSKKGQFPNNTRPDFPGHLWNLTDKAMAEGFSLLTAPITHIIGLVFLPSSRLSALNEDRATETTQMGLRLVPYSLPRKEINKQKVICGKTHKLCIPVIQDRSGFESPRQGTYSRPQKQL